MTGHTWTAIAVLTVGLFIIPGCDGDTFITQVGGEAQTVETLFPGMVLDGVNRFSDDGVAFTNSYSKIANGQFNVFWNCSNGTALLIYIDNVAHMWAKLSM